MKITIDCTLFKDCMKAVSGLVDEVSVSVTATEMAITAMDKANISMVDFHLPSESAIDWEVELTTEKPSEEFSFKLQHLNAALKRTVKEDVLKLELVKNQLQLSISGYKKFTIPLLVEDDDKKRQKVPELQHKAKSTLSVKRLAAAIEDCSTAGDSIRFSATEKNLVISAKGDITKAEVTLEGEDVKMEVQEAQKANYAREYLKRIVLPSLVDKVELSIGAEYPLWIVYKPKDYKLSFLLAPRVDNSK